MGRKRLEDGENWGEALVRLERAREIRARAKADAEESAALARRFAINTSNEAIFEVVNWCRDNGFSKNAIGRLIGYGSNSKVNRLIKVAEDSRGY